MSANRFITYRDTDENGNLQYYVVQKDFPHIQALITAYDKNYIFPSIPISGYSLYVSFDGTLSGKRVPAYREIQHDIVSVMNEMSEWYLNNRILPDKGRYKKFKINQYDTVWLS